MRREILFVGEAGMSGALYVVVVLSAVRAVLHQYNNESLDYVIGYMLGQEEGVSGEALWTCVRCGQVCCGAPEGEVGFDAEWECAVVRVSEGETLCGRCLQTQIQEQMQEARALQERFIYFKEFESSFEERELLRSSLQCQNEAVRAAEEEVRLLEAEEAAIGRDLSQLREASSQLKEKFYQLQAEEEKFWQGINKIERRTSKVEEKALNTKFDRLLSKAALDELARMSVLHLFLDIRVDDSLGYVQGMAMGRRSEGAEVVWEEVAVGLGHLLVGLQFLALKYCYEYHRIDEIVLRGAQSEVILQGRKKACVPMWREGDRQFGQLLEALLVQTAFLGEHILQAESIEYSQQFRMPFVINAGECKIVDLWIDPMKVEERTRWGSWTKAMRYFLIDFKHILTVFAINDKHL